MLVIPPYSVVQRIWWLLAAARVVTAGISCLSSPCLHGICIDDINTTYSCYCVDGYTGVQCQTNWDECWSNPCLNGGTCIDGVAAYNCSCPDGFIGDNCETNYDECESNPCLNNGTCIDMNNGYICSCIPGYSGEHCEMDVAVCNSTEDVRCYNGGQCIEGPGYKFYCRCLPGWAGPKCEKQIDECESNPCRNGGICIDIHADYMCACAFGFTGKSCEVQVEFCVENSCSNNALCVVEDGARVCYCVPDFHGDRCELQYDECLLGPRCMNGGTCIDGVDNFTCSCPPQLTGLLCECLILEEGKYDCEYVTPTPLSNYSQSFSTTLLEEVITDKSTEEISTIFLTSSDTSSTAVQTDAISTIPMDQKAKSSSQGTTEMIPIKVIDSTPEVAITSVFTTPKTTVSESVEEVIRQTIEPDNSNSESTTECQESCKDSDTKTSTTTEIDVTISTAEITYLPHTLLPTTETTEQSTITYLPQTLLPTKETTEQSTSAPSSTSKTSSTSSRSTTSSTSVTSSISTSFIPTISSMSTSTTTSTSTSTTVEIMINETTTETPEIDSGTDKIFTVNPTDPTMIDLVTTPHSVTEAVDVTHETDSTFVYTTVQSECTDAICNNHGTCINTPHGIRCHCVFQYGGRFCDEKISITSAAFGGNSFITHKLQNGTSIDIEFNAKTLMTDGQMMHVDIARGVYMQLCLNGGLLKFKFSCGYQTMLLSELKTFVNKGYPMKIETRLDLYLQDQHCNATLRLNDTVAMSGGQVANVTTLEHNSTLYLGKSLNTKDSEIKPFVGCIRDLIVNGKKRAIFGDALDAGEVTECLSLSCLSGPCFNGGSCSDHHDGGYTCSCANGWLGERCEQSVCEHNPCQMGGSCVRHPGSGFLCLCPYGKHGIFCEYNVEITRPSLAPISIGTSSYLMYPLSPGAINADRFDLRLRFQTNDMEQIALLAFVGQSGKHDSHSQHLALTFVKGYIMLTWNMGSGPRRVFTARSLSPRRGGHTVRVWRRGRAAGLNVDGRHNVSGNAPTHLTKMTFVPYIYIGGHPSQDFRDLPHDLPLHSGWRGCIWEISGQAIGASTRPSGGRGVGQCGVAQCTAKSCNAPRGVCIHSPATYGCICNEGWFGVTCSSSRNLCDRAHSKCQGQCAITADSETQCDCPYGKTGINCDQDLFPTDVLFSGTRSFLKLHQRVISSVSLSLEAEIKPAKERGLLIIADTPHFYTTLSLQGGLLEYRWTDRLSGVTSLVRSGVVVSMSQWHSVKAGRYGSRLYVWIDGALSTESMLAHAYPHTSSNASVLLGGAKDLSYLPFDIMSGPPESYTGCIRNLHVDNILLPLEQQNIQEGQNVADCDGTPCGVETCGGAACVVENGRATCSCGLSGSGTVTASRCRRHAACSPTKCASPRGVCRGDSCVCSAGYSGLYCDHEINITIPHFNGRSLLSLSRRSSLASHTSQKRISNMLAKPKYLTLNFTTDEVSGLLLWMTLDSDYIGIGLENGYVKIVWSLHLNNSSIEKTYTTNLVATKPFRTVSRLLPHAGFMADAEWHTLILKLLEKNITLTINKVVAYVEEPGLRSGSEYQDIDLCIGGVSEDHTIAKKIFPNNFKGCIDHISTRENSYITNFTEVYSENVESCQLLPLM